MIGAGPLLVTDGRDEHTLSGFGFTVETRDLSTIRQTQIIHDVSLSQNK